VSEINLVTIKEIKKLTFIFNADIILRKLFNGINAATAGMPAGPGSCIAAIAITWQSPQNINKNAGHEFYANCTIPSLCKFQIINIIV
jgi:hypothetical protein